MKFTSTMIYESAHNFTPKNSKIINYVIKVSLEYTVHMLKYWFWFQVRITTLKCKITSSILWLLPTSVGKKYWHTLINKPVMFFIT